MIPRYTFGNEDSLTEHIALHIKPEDTVLCVTASGDRPLNLLTKPCARMICIDKDRAQNELLIKKLMMMTSSFDEYMRQSRKFIYSGITERHCRMLGALMRAFRGRKTEQLFSFTNLGDQVDFVNEEWDTWLWRRMMDFACCKPVVRLSFGDRGMYEHSIFQAGVYLHDRITAYLYRDLARDSPFLSMAFLGYVPEEIYPPYLTKEGVKKIRPQLEKIEIITGDIVDYLNECEPDSIDKFSMSDVASYMPEPRFHEMVAGIQRAAKKRARFCIRQFMSRYRGLPRGFLREICLEDSLQAIDRSPVFSYMVGEVCK